LRSRSAPCGNSASLAGSTTPSDCAAKWNNREMLHALVSNGCSLQKTPAQKWGEPTQTLPKSHPPHRTSKPLRENPLPRREVSSPAGTLSAGPGLLHSHHSKLQPRITLRAQPRCGRGFASALAFLKGQTEQASELTFHITQRSLTLRQCAVIGLLASSASLECGMLGEVRTARENAHDVLT
jgi:hypothetical protein